MTTMTDPAPEVTKADAQIEEWRYAGLRVTGKDQRGHAWQDGTGRLLIFSGKGRHAIGATYALRVARRGTRVVTFGEPEFLDSCPDGDPLAEEWAIHSRAAELDLARLADERKARDHDPLADLTGRLGTLAAKCRTRAQRDALMATCAAVIYHGR